MEILTERPKDMSFDDYKTHLKLQKNWIKNKKQGSLYYLAIEMLYSPEDTYKLFGYRKVHPAFKGKAKRDLLNPV